MDGERYQKIQDTFLEALDRPLEERAQFLENACAGDPSLRAAVERYLRADAEHFSLFDAPSPGPGGLREPGEAIALSEGQTIGGYRIEGLLGYGGMGIVYKAVDGRLHRDVALKFLPPHLSADEDAKARFLHEARSAAALDHPHIGTIYEIAETDSGRLFIAMAYYEGETLKERIDRGPVPVHETVHIAIQIARGLDAAHRREIIHRDIKPANLIFTTEGLVKVVDFGIAKMAGLEQSQTGPLVGTVAYMSPEQARGEDVDLRTDLWSLGVVLYEMLTGRRPFGGEYAESLRYSIINEDPAPLDEDEVPRALQNVIDRLLSKDRDARYQQAAEVIADLEDMGGSAAVPTTLGKSPATDRLPSNLPIPLTSFVGRERELRQVTELLDTVRLLTLTGTGGAGKTRLALELASAVREQFADGICFVSLEPLRDSNLAAATIAQTLGVREMGGVPVRERLITFLRDKRALLILDNFEAVVDSAPLLGELLAACPNVKMLVTSRVPLRLQSEHEFPVPPLGLPEPERASLEDLQRTEAVALFAERAKAVRPTFALSVENVSTVAEICRRLDGLPLAIELAAARTKMLSPLAIQSRLQHRLDLLTSGARDLPARHRTLREAVAWSYDLLTKNEKRLFRRLSLFVGGCTLESAQSICSETTEDGFDVLDGMFSLVDKNLIRQEEQPDGEPRLLMFETIREFALECLVASGEEAVMRRKYRDYFLDLAERAAPLLTGPEQAVWLGRLAREHDNLRAAMDWTLDDEKNPGASSRFAAALWRFWLVHGYLDEGNVRLEKVLNSAGSDISVRMRTQLLTGAGTMAHNRGRYRAARSFYEQSLQLHRIEDDAQGTARALNNLGWTAWRLADYDAARELSEDSLRMHRENGDRHGEALALNNLGWVAHYRGEFAAAEDYFEEVLAIQQERNDGRGIAFARNCLGYAFAAQGRYERAVELLNLALTSFRDVGDRQLTAFTLARLGSVVHSQGDAGRALVLLEQESLPLFRTIGDTWGVAFTCARLGYVALDRGEIEHAESLFQQSMALRKESEDAYGIAESHAGIGTVYRLRSEPQKAVDRYKESLRQRLEIGDRSGLVESYEGLGYLSFDSGDNARATRLIGAAEAQLHSTNGVRPHWRRQLFEKITTSLRADLGEVAFSTLLEDGRKMTLRDAARYALDGHDAI